MRFPLPSATYEAINEYGRYVGRRLRRAKRLSMAADADTTTAAVLTAGRTWDDAAGPIQDALADRDAIDDDLDDTAEQARATLAGRSPTAMKEAPYILIFAQGIAYYTSAPIPEETKRYGELQARLEQHLPADDAVRLTTVAAIAPNLPAFDAAVKAVADARTAQALARTALDTARDGWERQMTKTYGVLLAELGKAKAERFFPKVRTKKAKTQPS